MKTETVPTISTHFPVKHLWTSIDIDRDLSMLVGMGIEVGYYIGRVVDFRVNKRKGKLVKMVKIEFEDDEVGNHYLLSIGVPIENIMSPFKA